jgi:hypothetical protein
LTAATRFLPHAISNVTPIAGMALFGAAFFKRSWVGLALPFATLWITDLILNNTILRHFYPETGFIWFTSLWVALGFLAIWAVGKLNLKSITPLRLVCSSVMGSVAFFLISNLSTFFETNLYTKDIQGLMTCYAAGIPFFRNEVLGDIVFTSIIFGAYYIITNDSKVKQMA